MRGNIVALVQAVPFTSVVPLPARTLRAQPSISRGGCASGKVDLSWVGILARCYVVALFGRGRGRANSQEDKAVKADVIAAPTTPPRSAIFGVRGLCGGTIGEEV